VHRFIVSHVRGNLVGYLALFVALGGTSYAAVQLKPGSVHARALARGAVTRPKLAPNSVDAGSVVNGSLTSADFKPGVLLKGVSGGGGARGVAGTAGPAGPAGPGGPAGPPGRDGSGTIGLAARQTADVVGTQGATTAVPLNRSTWTQDAGELDLIAGSLTMRIPAACTGSFGNALTVSVDGAKTTFGVAPTAPASGTVTVPIVVGTLMEPDAATSHTLTAQFGNSCTKAGEDYGVSGVKLDVIKFH
jgi:hypothetical protein